MGLQRGLVVTELDLIDLGIWWIPIPFPGTAGLEYVNAWAVEDVDGGVALFDCGFDSPQSLEALGCGLVAAGATFTDVRRIVISHGHLDHCGGVRRILDGAGWDIPVLVPRAEAPALGAVRGVRELRDGELLQFRHFRATARRMPGHTAGLTCLFADDEGIFFSSDHLLHGAMPIATYDRSEGGLTALEAYRESLLRLAALDVRVVLPGRGPPFAGHRRVVREVLSQLIFATPPDARPLRAPRREAMRRAPFESKLHEAAPSVRKLRSFVETNLGERT